MLFIYLIYCTRFLVPKEVREPNVHSEEWLPGCGRRPNSFGRAQGASQGCYGLATSTERQRSTGRRIFETVSLWRDLRCKLSRCRERESTTSKASWLDGRISPTCVLFFLFVFQNQVSAVINNSELDLCAL